MRSQTQLELCADGIGSRLNPSRPRESELASHSHALASPAPGVCFASRGWVMVVVGAVGGVPEPAPLVAVSKVAALALEDMGLRQRRRVLGSRASVVAVRLNCHADTVLKAPRPPPGSSRRLSTLHRQVAVVHSGFVVNPGVKAVCTSVLATAQPQQQVEAALALTASVRPSQRSGPYSYPKLAGPQRAAMYVACCSTGHE